MSELWTWLLVVLIIGCLFALLHMLETTEGFEVQTATELQKAILQATSTPVVSQPLSAESQKIMDMLKQNTVENKITAGIASSSSGSNVPNNADTTRSSPSSANITSPTSPVLQQGAVAQKYITSMPIPEPKIIVIPVPSNERPAPSCPSACPKPCPKPSPKSCDVPEPKKACRPPKWEPGMPVPDYCPTMPDMKDYIRKDSIPCWACKL